MACMGLSYPTQPKGVRDDPDHSRRIDRADLPRGLSSDARQNLKVNDGSLRYGGLYDFNENWDTPHSTHRDGKNVDIKPMTNSGANDPKWNFLRVRIRRLGSTFYDEVNTNAPHLHFIQ